MVFRKTACALTLMFSACSIAQPAAATTILITYTGTVTGGSDAAGLFGTPSASLANDKFTSVYTLTYPTPGAIEKTSTPGLDEIYGGTCCYQSATSPLSGQLTINDHTVSINGKYAGDHKLISPAYLSNHFNGKVSEIFDQVSSNTGAYLYNVVYNVSGDNFISSLNFAGALNHTVTSSDVTDGRFHFINEAGLSSYANFENLAVSVQSISAVPEPATWGMMIFGFGIAGVTLRARRRETALA